MRYNTAEEKIRDKHSHHPSVDDQVFLLQWFVAQGLHASEDEWTRKRPIERAIVDKVDTKVQTLLNNLEELDLLEKKDLQGGRSFIRSERTDEMFFTPEDDDFRQLLAEEVSRLLEDIQDRDREDPDDEVPLTAVADGGDNTGKDDFTLREVAAEALEVEPAEVETELTTPADPVDRMENYDTVVVQIENRNEVQRGRNYDRLGWRNRANRWALSSHAKQFVDANSSEV
ncbi:hypothetical protein [Halorhabdus salina]|uniref:hypothetical protein n=1 Tax=Halorhabdus salina TaxID=2750670 RepID=UPI0015EE9567|nr:hypothetical protein [Halorhabdus salina]